MDWHINREQLEAAGEKDQSGHSLGWTGYTWNKLLFPDPDAVPRRLHAEGLKTSSTCIRPPAFSRGKQPIRRWRKAMGIDPATKKYVPFDITNKKFATNYIEPAPPSAGEAGHRLLVARLAAGANTRRCPA